MTDGRPSNLKTVFAPALEWMQHFICMKHGIPKCPRPQSIEHEEILKKIIKKKDHSYPIIVGKMTQ